MIEDAELLRRFAEEKSEEALAELVRRRVDFVYACALRRVGGDAHAAEDVTQQVFMALARAAGELKKRAVLGGWLYTTARQVSAQVVRGERRRKTREQEAHLMHELNGAPTNDAEWARLRPVLDEAMDELRDEDREAVLARFFEGRTFGEIGVQLRLSENTVRMRVERALDTLQGRLARRGVTSTAAALGIALAGQASVAAPAGLAASATAAALAGVGAVGSGVGWGIFMSMTKLQMGIAGAVAAAGVAGYGWQAETNAELRREIAVAQEQQTAVAALKVENQRLAGAAAEVEMLRRDDAELKQLAQRAAEVKALNEAKARVAQTQTRMQERRKVLEALIQEKDRSAQEEIERLNKEGNRLVMEYKALAAGAKEVSLTPEARAEADGAAKAKLAEIQAKQREVQALTKRAREALAESPEMIELRSLPPGPTAASPAGRAGPGRLELRSAPSSGEASGAAAGLGEFKFVPGPKPASQP